MTEERIHLPKTHNIEPRPLPSQELIEEIYRHIPQAKRVREHRFNDWYDTPVEGGLWSAWGMHARPDRIGMTYMAINKVSPNAEPEEEGRARVTLTRYIKSDPRITPDLQERLAPKYGGSRELDKKCDVWLENASEMAEEALARQWRPNRTLKWDTMKVLAPEVERAFDQFLTYLIQCQYLASDAMGPWARLVHYNFPEIKSCLAYEIFDYSLHCGMLRKRVMSNGGGMGVQIDGLDAGVREACNEASHAFVGEVDRDFNAMVLTIHLFFNGIVLEMLRLGEAAAQSEFDQGLFRQMIQDNARHVAWGCHRIRYYLNHSPEREEAIIRLNGVAEKLETAQVGSHLLNPDVLEPLAVLLGGPEKQAKGFGILRQFWPQISENYLARLDAVGLNRRDRCLIPSEAPF